MAETVYERVVVGGDNLTLSLLVWRKFKRPMPGLVARILDRQGELAEKLTLDIGDVVEIPIDPPRERVFRKPVRKLWD